MADRQIPLLNLIKNELIRTTRKNIRAITREKALHALNFGAFYNAFESQAGDESFLRAGQAPQFHCLYQIQISIDKEKLFFARLICQSKTHSENRLKKQLITVLH